MTLLHLPHDIIDPTFQRFLLEIYSEYFITEKHLRNGFNSYPSYTHITWVGTVYAL